MARRPRKAAPSAAPESLMAFYLRNRGITDQWIDADVQRSCEGKQPYKSEGEARAIAAMQGMSGALFTYDCRYCGFWHLTRRKPKAPDAPFD